MREGIRENILRTALMLFSRYGYETVSLRQLAFDAGIRRNVLGEYFQSKEEVLDAVLEFVGEWKDYYAPAEDDVLELLHQETPQEILSRYVTFNDTGTDHMIMDIFRLLYMEQYRSEAIKQITYEQLLEIPVTSVTGTLDTLIREGAVPFCDSGAMAELWHRTMLIFGMLGANRDQNLIVEIPYHLYTSSNQFFIDIMTRGVSQIPLEGIHMEWQMPFHGRSHFDDMGPRGRIMSKALDLFSEDGYNLVSIRQIAGELDMSVSTIYRYFRGKSEIMKAIVQILMDLSNRFTPDVSAFKADLQSRDPVDIVLSFSSIYPPPGEDLLLKLYRILFREQYLNDELRVLFKDSLFRDVAAVKKVLDDMVSIGRIWPCSTHDVALGYVFSMCSMNVGMTIFPDKIDDLNQLRVRMTAILLSYVLNGFLDQQKT